MAAPLLVPIALLPASLSLKMLAAFVVDACLLRVLNLHLCANPAHRVCCKAMWGSGHAQGNLYYVCTGLQDLEGTSSLSADDQCTAAKVSYI